MKHIKLIQGAYRYRPDPDKSAVVVQVGDPPFDVPDAEAQRLVDLGMAVCIEQNAAIPRQQDLPLEPEHQAPPQEESAAPVYSIKNTARELAELMESYGLPTEKGQTKRQMIEALDAYFQTDELSDEDIEAPDLTALSAVVP